MDSIFNFCNIILVLIDISNDANYKKLCGPKQLFIFKLHFLIFLINQERTQISALVEIGTPSYRLTISGDRYDSVVYLFNQHITSSSSLHCERILNKWHQKKIQVDLGVRK